MKPNLTVWYFLLFNTHLGQSIWYVCKQGGGGLPQFRGGSGTKIFGRLYVCSNDDVKIYMTSLLIYWFPNFGGWGLKLLAGRQLGKSQSMTTFYQLSVKLKWEKISSQFHGCHENTLPSQSSEMINSLDPQILPTLLSIPWRLEVFNSPC